MKFLTPRLTELLNKRNALCLEKTNMVAEIAAVRARMAKESPSDGNAADNRVRAILGETILPESVAFPFVAYLGQGNLALAYSPSGAYGAYSGRLVQA